MVRFSIVVGLLLSFVGCVKSTDSVVPGHIVLPQDRSLYVACFISPQDTVLRAKVAELTAITSAPAQPVDNARISISDGRNELPLYYNDTLDEYQNRPNASFVVRAGVTYRITVSMTDGRKLEATATVPPAVPISRVAIDSVLTTQADNRSIRYRATLTWTSPAGLTYYRGWGRFEQTIRTPPSQSATVQVSQPDFPLIRGNTPSPEFYTTTGSFTLTVPVGSQVRTKRVTLGLFTTDVNYYQYHASLQEQLATPVSFFTNAPVLFSNVQGGYGVFAAYNATYINR